MRRLVLFISALATFCAFGLGSANAAGAGTLLVGDPTRGVSGLMPATTGGAMTDLSCHPSSYRAGAALPFIAIIGDSVQSHLVGWQTTSCGSPVPLYDFPPGVAAVGAVYSSSAKSVIFVVSGTSDGNGNVIRSTCPNLCGAWIGDVNTSGTSPKLDNVRLVFPDTYDAATGYWTNTLNAELSGDGQTVALNRTQRPGGLSTVYIGNVATGALAPIPSPTSGAHDTSPRLSPDGSQVAFLRNVSTAGLNRSDLWVAPVTCGGQATCASARQLTSKSNISNNAVRNRPCWSPTGDALMFNVFLSSSLTYQVDKITLSSGQVTAITGKSQNRVALDWQP